MPISARQVAIRDGLNNDKGKESSAFKSLLDNLHRFSYSENELDLIEKQLNIMPEYQRLIKLREKK